MEEWEPVILVFIMMGVAAGFFILWSLETSRARRLQRELKRIQAETDKCDCRGQPNVE